MERYIDLVPLFLQEYKEIKKLDDSSGPLLDLLKSLINQIYDNQYITLSDEETVEKWEKIFSIISDNSISLDERKQRLLNRKRMSKGFTLQYLKNLLNDLYGVNNVELQVIQPYTLKFRVSTANSFLLNEGVFTIQQMIPANILIQREMFMQNNIMIVNHAYNLETKYFRCDDTDSKCDLTYLKEIKREVIIDA